MPTDTELVPVSTTAPVPVTEIDISQKVYTIRGEKVMLDTDLAEIYGYTVKAMNQQVKRNKERFPEDFIFRLTREETDSVRSQFVTSPNGSFFEGQDGGRRYLPYAFTEQGVYMLATVLKGELASSQSIAIMRAFRAMRTYIQQNPLLITQAELKAITARQDKTDEKLEALQKTVDELGKNFISGENIQEFIILNGQKFEADVAYTSIYAQARKSIFVVDDYVSIKTLQLLSKKNSGVAVTLATDNKAKASERLTTAEVTDFNTEYPTLTIKPNTICHDRMIVLDYKLPTEKVYMCGASSKDAGAKLCAINELQMRSLVYSTVDKILAQPDKTL